MRAAAYFFAAALNAAFFGLNLYYLLSGLQKGTLAQAAANGAAMLWTGTFAVFSLLRALKDG